VVASAKQAEVKAHDEDIESEVEKVLRRRPHARRLGDERRTAMGERNERAKTKRKAEEEEPKTAESIFRSEAKGKPIYFSCAGRPRDFKKSEITLYNIKGL
jgi:ethanolamine utilization cobalamin adenosyltransferase